MRLASHLTLVLLFVMSMYSLRICARDFRRTRGSGTHAPHFYGLGIVLSGALMILAAIGVFIVVFRRFH